MTSAPPVAVLFRHGETTWSATGRHTGRTDIELTARGVAQAEALAARVAGRTFDAVLVQPAGPGPADRGAGRPGPRGGRGGPDGVGLRRFRGSHHRRDPPGIPGLDHLVGPWPGGETIDQVAARADRVVARVRRLPAGSVVALVGHGHMLRVLGARWIGAPAQTGRSLALETGTVSELGWEHETPVVQRWNT